MGQAWPFRIEEASRYDARGPGWYWNNFSCSEHTGTHFDAPIHWISGRHLPDNSTDTIPAESFIAPACVIDCSRESAADADFLLTVDFLKKWERRHGRIPPGSWILMRTDWSKRTDPVAYQNIDETGQHTPGPDSEAVQFLVEERQVLGFGSEAIGTDAGQGFHLKPPYPCHYYMHGSGRFGLQCLTNLDLLPPVGAVIIAAPLKIKEGSGSPLRVLALVPEPAATALRRRARRPRNRKSAKARRGERSADERRRHPGRFPAGRTHAAGDAAAAGAPLRQPLLCSLPAMCSWSFEETPHVAARFAGTLAAAGIRPGDRVALMCGNRAEFIESFLGCAWLGAIAVPINVASRGPQLAHFLQQFRRAAPDHRGGTARRARAHRHAMGLRWSASGSSAAQRPAPLDRIAVTSSPPRAEAIAPGAADPAQTLAILYTSGTTGPSKGVCCPHAQYFWWGLNGVRNLEIARRRRAFHHAAAVSHQRARAPFTRLCCPARRSSPSRAFPPHASGKG